MRVNTTSWVGLRFVNISRFEPVASRLKPTICGIFLFHAVSLDVLAAGLIAVKMETVAWSRDKCGCRDIAGSPRNRVDPAGYDDKYRSRSYGFIERQKWAYLRPPHHLTPKPGVDCG